MQKAPSLFEKGPLALVGVKGFRLNPTLARYVKSKLGPARTVNRKAARSKVASERLRGPGLPCADRGFSSLSCG